MANRGAGTESVVTEEGRDYYRVVIQGSTADTTIWIADDHGHPVVKAVGNLDTHLLPGDYTIEFGVNRTTYPLALSEPVELEEVAVRKGPTCPRPAFRFYE